MPRQPTKPRVAASGPMPYNLRTVKGRATRGTRKAAIKEKGEWDDVRCPICLDPPHKAILLICSSHNKGCRPYVCDTYSYLSNCFDKFCDSRSVKRPAKRTSDGERPTKFQFSAGPHRLPCPLCRGEVTGWLVDQRARSEMNSIVRTCQLDGCDISGDYEDLKFHAKFLHDDEDAEFIDEDDSDYYSDYTEDEDDSDLE